MKYLQKLLAIFLVFFSIILIFSGLLGYEAYGFYLSFLFMISGFFILHISGKTLIFNPKSMKAIKSKIRKIELIMKYGDKGKIMALKEIYSEKNTQELLERYKQDYNKVRNDVKIVMIEELRKRKLIDEKEYSDKRNEIDEKIEEEKEKKLKQEEEKLKEEKAKEEAKNINKIEREQEIIKGLKKLYSEMDDEKLLKEFFSTKNYTKNSKLVIVPEIIKRKLMDEKEINKKIDWINKEAEEERLKKDKYIGYIFIGIFIGIIPIMSFFNGEEVSQRTSGYAVLFYPLIAIIGCFIALIVVTAITKDSIIFGSAILTFVASIFLYQLNYNITNKIDQKKSVALSIAAKEKDYKKCEKLLKKYKNTYNDPDSQGYNSLHYALVNRDENLIKLLVENKIYLITKDNLNNYNFFNFSENAKDTILNDLEILWGGSPNKIIFKEIYETKENQKELIEKFYENGMSINIKPEEGRDNLLRSVILSKVSDDEKIRSLDFLTEHGIDMNRYNSYSKENILYELIDRPSLIGIEKVLKYAEYLIKKGLNVNSTNRDGENLLHKAFGTKNNEIIDFLIKNKVNLEQKNEKGQTPLLEIFNSSKISIQELKSYLSYYYKNNANPFIVDKYKENIIDYINRYNNKNENSLEKKEIEDFKNELIKDMKNKNGDKK